MNVVNRGRGRAIVYDPKYIGFVQQEPPGNGAWQAHVVMKDGDHRFVGLSRLRRDAVRLVTQLRER